MVHLLVEHLIKVLSTMSQQVLEAHESDRSDDEGDESEVRSDTENNLEQAEASSGDRESLSTMSTANIIEELKGSVMSRFQSVLVDDTYQMASFLNACFKATYCQLADVTANIKNEMRRMASQSRDRSETASHSDVSSTASVTETGKQIV